VGGEGRFPHAVQEGRDVPAIFPCRSEEAQRHFLRVGFATAQWLPGLLRHIGAQRSRRL